MQYFSLPLVIVVVVSVVADIGFVENIRAPSCSGRCARFCCEVDCGIVASACA